MDTDLVPEVEEEALEGAAPEAPAAENEQNPAAELSARFDGIESELARLKGLDPDSVRSGLGRISSLQSDIDDLRKRDPVAAIDPRVSANEALTMAVADALLNDPAVDAALKASLRSAVTGVERARTQREQEMREAALEARVHETIARSAPKVAAEPAAGEAQWVKATTTIRARANSMGVSAEGLPWAELRTASGEDPDEAIALAVGWLYEHREDPTAIRVSARRAAAAPSPARAGVPANDLEKYLAFGAGTLDIPDNELRAIESRLKSRGEI